MPYYLCVNGTINTDGSDLLDIRFGEGEECVDYFEQCCATGNVLEIPIMPPNLNPIPVTGGCGLRNAEGVGFRITGEFILVLFMIELCYDRSSLLQKETATGSRNTVILKNSLKIIFSYLSFPGKSHAGGTLGGELLN